MCNSCVLGEELLCIVKEAFHRVDGHIKVSNGEAFNDQ